MRLLFLIRQLNYGGAQRQLTTLANGLARHGHSVAIALYYRGEGIEDLDPGIPRFYFDKQGRWDLLQPFLSLVKIIREFRPEILHSYLSTSNLLAVLVKPFAFRVPVVWGKRDALPNYESYDRFEKLILRLEPVFSRFADLVIFNSPESMQVALDRGYPRGTARVIGNGIDADLFQIDPLAGQQMRSAWGVSEDEKLIGIVGRLHAEKDHATYFRASALLWERFPGSRFVCVGSGEAGYQALLKQLACELGLQDRILWVEPQTNMTAVYNALDMLVSSSFSESFPNVVLEAMACGVPCVVTDVGASSRAVAELGIVVPARDPQALAAGMEQMLNRLKQVDHERLRTHVVKNFSAKTLVQNTEKELLNLLEK